MQKRFNIPNLAFLMMMGVAVASLKTHAASNIQASGLNMLQSNIHVYDRVLNPYINITTDKRAAGNTYSIRNEQGRIIRTGIITSGRILAVATGKLGAGTYTVHVGGHLLQQFSVK